VTTSDDERPEGIGEHRMLQRRMWRLQRLSWIAYGIILVAALAGLTGKGGHFSRGMLETPAGTVEYPAIARLEAPDELAVFFEPSATPRIVSLDAAFFALFSVESIDPPPERTESGGELTRYVYPANADQALRVRFRLQTHETGLYRPALGVADTLSRPLVVALP
jgi:protein-L-isoaspartate(D-aspartate) O-methyltransferase